MSFNSLASKVAGKVAHEKFSKKELAAKIAAGKAKHDKSVRRAFGSKENYHSMDGRMA